MNERPTTTKTQETIKQLDRIRWIAIADFLLLIPLVLNVTGLIDIEAVIPVLGSIHGAGFLALLYLCVKGVGEERWGWWFPAIVLVTLGPPGSLYGEHRIRGEL